MSIEDGGRLEGGPLGGGARVLVTGGSGRIGRHLIDELKSRNIGIRALTSKPLTEAQASDRTVEWVQHDFQASLDLDRHVAGCAAVLHLAGEVWDIPKMQRVNVEATAALAQAAERSGVTFFGYTSSVAVYGSSIDACVTEETPVLTADHDVRAEYRGNASIRTYGRTKLLAERALAAVARRVEYVVFRPTVVVDLPDILALAKRSRVEHRILGRRHEHHIYVKDVVHAMLWFMDRALRHPEPMPGIEVFNLSDDEAEHRTSDAFLAQAFRQTGDPRFRLPVAGPIWVYDLFDLLKNKMLSRRQPLGKMLFSPAKLYATGYRHKFGMTAAQKLSLDTLKKLDNPAE